MNVQLFTIYDIKSEAHLPIFSMRNKGEALRAFESTVKDKDNKNNQIAQYPSDYVLKLIGSFDDLSGVITPIEPHQILATGTEFVH